MKKLYKTSSRPILLIIIITIIFISIIINFLFILVKQFIYNVEI